MDDESLLSRLQKNNSNRKMTLKRKVREKVRLERQNMRQNLIVQKKKLIEEVRKREVIWNRELKVHKDRLFVENQWDEISEAVLMNKGDCKKQWKNSVDHFRNLVHFLMAEKNGGPLTKLDYEKPKWTYFKSLLFLKDQISRKNPSISYDEGVNLDENKDTETEQQQPLVLFQVYEDGEASQNHPGFTEVSQGLNSNINNESTVTPRSPPANNIESMAIASLPYQKSKRKDLIESEKASHSILAELSDIKKHLRVMEDDATRFGKYIASIIREVPSNKRRRCEFEIIKLANVFADGKSFNVQHK